MNDEHLPGFYHDAEAVSRLGQRLTLLFSRVRLIGAVVAAAGGAFQWQIGGGVFATLRINGVWDVDLSGVMAAAVAGGAAWSDWAAVVAETETEAVIGKEHAAWLASRPSAT